MEDHRCQQEAYAFGASIDSPCETSSLSREVEVQVQLEKMLKNIASHTTDSFLGYAGKDGISELLEDSSSDPCSSIYQVSQYVS